MLPRNKLAAAVPRLEPAIHRVISLCLEKANVHHLKGRLALLPLVTLSSGTAMSSQELRRDTSQWHRNSLSSDEHISPFTQMNTIPFPLAVEKELVSTSDQY